MVRVRVRVRAVGEGRLEDGRAQAEDQGVGCEAHGRLVPVGGLQGDVSGSVR